MRHTFDVTGWVNSFVFVFRVWVRFHKTEANIFYVSIRTTEIYQFDKFRTAGVTGNAIINSQGQGDNPVCSTRDEILQPSRSFSPRAATDYTYRTVVFCVVTKPYLVPQQIIF